MHPSRFCNGIWGLTLPPEASLSHLQLEGQGKDGPLCCAFLRAEAGPRQSLLCLVRGKNQDKLDLGSLWTSGGGGADLTNSDSWVTC